MQEPQLSENNDLFAHATAWQITIQKKENVLNCLKRTKRGKQALQDAVADVENDIAVAAYYLQQVLEKISESGVSK